MANNKKSARRYVGPLRGIRIFLDRYVDRRGKRPGAIFVPRKRPPHFALCVAVTTMKLLVAFTLIFGFVCAGTLFGIASSYINTAPELDLSAISNTAVATEIRDANGVLLTTYSNGTNRMWASYDELPQNLINAVVATEDARFFQHKGVDIKRIVGSFISNYTSSSVQGASTITQQLIKNRMLTSERSYRRKIQEAYLAFQLEKEYSKTQILEAYLNDVYLSQGNYGVKGAALDYFGKNLDELNLRECATLAGMLQSPNLYDPRKNYYTRSKPEVTDNRTNTVLNRMYQNGYISYDEYQAAVNEPLAVLKEDTNTALGIAPDFVDYVIKDVIDHFLVARGLANTSENRKAIDSELRLNGYTIYTTVDMVVQEAAEDNVYNYKNYPKTKSPSDATTNTDPAVIQPQASCVVFDYTTGQIKAIVGGRTAPIGLKVLNRAYMAHMPVGSSIKPLAVYAPALDNAKLGAGTVIWNLEGRIEGWDDGPDGKGYPSPGSVIGPVSMRTAIKSSLNLSAARVLLQLSGEDALEVSAAYLESFGLDMDYVQKTPAGLALGTSGISAMDEAVAYGAIANGGIYIDPISFTHVEDSNGNVLLDATAMQTEHRVISKSSAWMLIDMLTTAVESGTGTRAKVNGITVAGKTGTNDNYRGVTFAGMTPHYSCAIWIGHDNYKALQTGASGGTYAAPLFKNIMTDVYSKKGLSNRAIMPESPLSLGLTQVTVCPVSGMLATDACSLDAGGLEPFTDWFHSDYAPFEPCTYHVQTEYCVDSGKIATEGCINKVPLSYVKAPLESVLATCDLKDFPWFYICDQLLTSATHPDAFCSIHSGMNAEQVLRANAIAKAKTVLADAGAFKLEKSSVISAEELTELDRLIEDLNTKINAVSFSTEEINTEAEALKQYLDNLKTLYA